MKRSPKLKPTKWDALVVLAVLLIPKLAQEWLLHFAQFHPWQWLKSTIGRAGGPGTLAG